MYNRLNCSSWPLKSYFIRFLHHSIFSEFTVILLKLSKLVKNRLYHANIVVTSEPLSLHNMLVKDLCLWKKNVTWRIFSTKTFLFSDFWRMKNFSILILSPGDKMPYSWRSEIKLSCLMCYLYLYTVDCKKVFSDAPIFSENFCPDVFQGAMFHFIFRQLFMIASSFSTIITFSLILRPR